MSRSLRLSTFALASLALVAVLAPNLRAAPAPTLRCTAAIARAPEAQYCVRYAAGFVQFQTSMSAPASVFTINGDGLQVVGFPDWIIVVKTDGEHVIVPRERFIYSADTKFGDD